MERELFIGSRRIADDEPCYVVAEIGSNHMGRVELALEMVEAAARCGVDAVKFQKRDNRSLYTREYYDSPYENENSFGRTYGEHREALELKFTEFIEIRNAALHYDIDLVVTPFDIQSADEMNDLGVDAFKTASGDLTNIPLLKHIAGFGKPMLVSTGGATMEDVVRAHIGTSRCPRAFLQCTSSYPVEIENMNLRVIETYREEFPGVVIGLSDHQSGIAMSLVAWCLGARIIEKHFTLHRAWKGTDQAFSLEPEGMRKLVRDLRRAPLAMGNGVKRVLECEREPIRKMGKMIVAARDIRPYQTIVAEDLAFKSPQDGLPPYMADQLIGKTTMGNCYKDEPILLEEVE